MTEEHNDDNAELRQFIERYEALDASRRDISADMKEVMAEAKSRGYDTRILKQIIGLRKLSPDDRAERDAVLDIYMRSIGML